MMTPTLLALDTSAVACSIALSHKQEVFTFHKIAARQQASLILPAVQSVLDAGGIRLNQLDAIAYGCGPGSFTGIRLACSVAQGLGFAMQLPLISISSLAILAQTVYQMHNWTKILTLVDARMHKLHGALFVVNQHKQVELKETEQHAVLPDKLILPSDGGWYGAGDGWRVYTEQQHLQLEGVDAAALPNASAMLTLAQLKYEQEDWIKAQSALPVY